MVVLEYAHAESGGVGDAYPVTEQPQVRGEGEVGGTRDVGVVGIGGVGGFDVGDEGVRGDGVGGEEM
jgi:hypothetical protein